MSKKNRDNIGKWYERKSNKAAYLRKLLRKLDKNDHEKRKKLQKELELIEYVGD